MQLHKKIPSCAMKERERGGGAEEKGRKSRLKNRKEPHSNVTYK